METKPILSLCLRKSTAIFLSFSLTLLNSLSYAQAPAGQADSRFPLVEEAPSQTLPKDLAQLSLPAELGAIQEIHQGNSNQTVIYLEDAHTLYEAQKSIQGLIGYFQKIYGVRVVALEGGQGKLDPFLFRSFPNSKTLNAVFEDYLQKGELSGAAAASVLGKGEADYYGIEEKDLFEKGTLAYLEAQKVQPGLLRSLAEAQRALDEQKKKFYPGKLLELDQKSKAFEQHSLDMVSFLKSLMSLRAESFGKLRMVSNVEPRSNPYSEIASYPAGTRNDSRNYPHLEALFKEIEDEKRPDPEKVQAKIVELSKILKPLVREKSNLKEFNQKTQAYRTSQLASKEFAHYLLEKAKLFGIDLSPFKSLQDFIQNYPLLLQMQASVFFDELESYLQKIKTTFLTTAELRRLDQEDRKLFLLKRLAKLELTRKELEELKGTQKEDLPEFQIYREFYEIAEAREKSLYENLKKLGQKPTAVIFLSGGFHTRGMTEALKKDKVSYVLISPRITQIPQESPYPKIMRGEVSWKNYFQVENGRVNLFNAFAQGTIDRLLAYGAGRMANSKDTDKDQTDFLSAIRYSLSANLLKTWRDEIIKGLAAQEKTGRAREYTRFIDEAALKSLRTEERQPVENEFRNRIDQFLGGLKNLIGQNKLSEENILRLFQKPASMPAVNVASLIPGFDMSAEGFVLEDRSQTLEIRSTNVIAPLASDLRPLTSGFQRAEVRSYDGKETGQEGEGEKQKLSYLQSLMDKDMILFSTPAAYYIFHRVIHLKETKISDEILGAVDALVFEKNLDRYLSETPNLYEFPPAKGQHSDLLMKNGLRFRKPVFLAEAPPKKGMILIDFLLHVIGLGLPIELFLDLSKIIFASDTSFFTKTLMFLPVLLLVTPVSSVIFIFLSSLFQRFLPKHLTKHLNLIQSYLMLSNFYTANGFRSALVAKKLEELIVPNIRSWLMKSGDLKKPVMLIEYGAAHSDMKVYLQHKKLRDIVIGLGSKIWFQLDKNYFDKALQINIDAEGEVSQIIHSFSSRAEVRSASSKASQEDEEIIKDLREQFQSRIENAFIGKRTSLLTRLKLRIPLFVAAGGLFILMYSTAALAWEFFALWITLYTFSFFNTLRIDKVRKLLVEKDVLRFRRSLKDSDWIEHLDTKLKWIQSEAKKTDSNQYLQEAHFQLVSLIDSSSAPHSIQWIYMDTLQIIYDIVHDKPHIPLEEMKDHVDRYVTFVRAVLPGLSEADRSSRSEVRTPFTGRYTKEQKLAMIREAVADIHRQNLEKSRQSGNPALEMPSIKNVSLRTGLTRDEIRNLDRETLEKEGIVYKLDLETKLQKIRKTILDLQSGQRPDIETISKLSGLSIHQLYQLERETLEKEGVLFHEPVKKMHEAFMKKTENRLKNIEKTVQWLKTNKPQEKITSRLLSQTMREQNLENINYRVLEGWLRRHGKEERVIELTSQIQKKEKTKRIKKDASLTPGVKEETKTTESLEEAKIEALKATVRININGMGLAADRGNHSFLSFSNIAVSRLEVLAKVAGPSREKEFIEKVWNRFTRAEEKYRGMKEIADEELSPAEEAQISEIIMKFSRLREEQGESEETSRSEVRTQIEATSGTFNDPDPIKQLIDLELKRIKEHEVFAIPRSIEEDIRTIFEGTSKGNLLADNKINLSEIIRAVLFRWYFDRDGQAIAAMNRVEELLREEFPRLTPEVHRNFNFKTGPPQEGSYQISLKFPGLKNQEGNENFLKIVLILRPEGGYFMEVYLQGKKSNAPEHLRGAKANQRGLQEKYRNLLDALSANPNFQKVQDQFPRRSEARSEETPQENVTQGVFHLLKEDLQFSFELYPDGRAFIYINGDLKLTGRLQEGEVIRFGRLFNDKKDQKSMNDIPVPDSLPREIYNSISRIQLQLKYRGKDHHWQFNNPQGKPFVYRGRAYESSEQWLPLFDKEDKEKMWKLAFEKFDFAVSEYQAKNVLLDRLRINPSSHSNDWVELSKKLENVYAMLSSEDLNEFSAVLQAPYKGFYENIKNLRASLIEHLQKLLHRGPPQQKIGEESQTEIVFQPAPEPAQIQKHFWTIPRIVITALLGLGLFLGSYMVYRYVKPWFDQPALKAPPQKAPPARAEVRAMPELKESLLSKPDIELKKVILTLENLKPGEPTVELRFRPVQDSLVVEVWIDNKKTGKFTLHWPSESEITYLQISDVLPFGDEGTKNFEKYNRRGVMNTILNWLSWEAAQQGLEMRNSGTSNLRLVRLYQKYFAEQFNSGNQWKDLKALIRQYGFYGRETLGHAEVEKISKKPSFASAWLELKKLPEHPREDVYEITEVRQRVSTPFKVGQRFVVSPEGRFTLLPQKPEAKRRIFNYQITHAMKGIQVAGKPRNWVTPRGNVRSEVRAAEKSLRPDFDQELRRLIEEAQEEKMNPAPDKGFVLEFLRDQAQKKKKEMGIGVNTLAAIENGEKNPSRDILLKISKILQDRYDEIGKEINVLQVLAGAFQMDEFYSGEKLQALLEGWAQKGKIGKLFEFFRKRLGLHWGEVGRNRDVKSIEQSPEGLSSLVIERIFSDLSEKYTQLYTENKDPNLSPARVKDLLNQAWEKFRPGAVEFRGNRRIIIHEPSVQKKRSWRGSDAMISKPKPEPAPPLSPELAALVPEKRIEALAQDVHLLLTIPPWDTDLIWARWEQLITIFHKMNEPDRLLLPEKTIRLIQDGLKTTVQEAISKNFQETRLKRLQEINRFFQHWERGWEDRRDKQARRSQKGPRSEVRAQAEGRVYAPRGPPVSGWLAYGIQTRIKNDQRVNELNFKNLPDKLPALARSLKSDRELLDIVEERTTDEGQAFHALLERIKNQAMRLRHWGDIDVTMISFPLVYLNQLSKNYWPGFTDIFKDVFHHVLANHHIDAAFIGGRILLRNVNPSQAEESLPKWIEETYQELKLLYKQQLQTDAKKRREFGKALVQLVKNLPLFYTSHARFFLKEPPKNSPLPNPARNLKAVYEVIDQDKPQELSGEEFEKLTTPQRQNYLKSVDDYLAKRRRRLSEAASYWLNKFYTKPTKHSRGNASFFIDLLLKDLFERLYERGEVLEKSKGELKDEINRIMQSQIQDRNKLATVFSQDMVQKFKASSSRYLPEFYEALQEGRRNALPLYNFKTGRLPRPLHRLDLIRNYSEALQWSFNELKAYPSRAEFKEFKEIYASYSAMLNEALELAYRDPRLEDYYKLNWIEEVAKADEAGLIAKWKDHLAGRSMEERKVADQITPGLFGFKRAIGDEIGFLVSVGDGYRQALSELNKGNAYFKFRRPDDRDSDYHHILLGYLDAAKKYRQQQTPGSPWWGFLNDFDSVIEQVTQGVRYPSKEKVEFQEGRLASFVLKGDTASKIPAYVKEGTRILERDPRNIKKWIETDKVKSEALEPFLTQLTTSSVYHPNNVSPESVAAMFDKTDELVAVQKEHPELAGKPVSTRKLTQLKNAARSEMRSENEKSDKKSVPLDLNKWDRVKIGDHLFVEVRGFVHQRVHLKITADKFIISNTSFEKGETIAQSVGRDLKGRQSLKIFTPEGKLYQTIKLERIYNVVISIFPNKRERQAKLVFTGNKDLVFEIDRFDDNGNHRSEMRGGVPPEVPPYVLYFNDAQLEELKKVRNSDFELRLRTDLSRIYVYKGKAGNYLAKEPVDKEAESYFHNEALIMQDILKAVSGSVPSQTEDRYYRLRLGVWDESHKRLMLPHLEGESGYDFIIHKEEPTTFIQYLQTSLEIISPVSILHRYGIVHRDLKPDNYFVTQDLVTKDNRWILIDFNLAYLKNSGRPIPEGLTPAFSSPEQFYPGHEPDFRDDVYSLGKTLLWNWIKAKELGPEKEKYHNFEMENEEIFKNFNLSKNPLGDILQKALSLRSKNRYTNAMEMEKAVVDRLRELKSQPERLGMHIEPPALTSAHKDPAPSHLKYSKVSELPLPENPYGEKAAKEFVSSIDPSLQFISIEAIDEDQIRYKVASAEGTKSSILKIPVGYVYWNSAASIGTQMNNLRDGRRKIVVEDLRPASLNEKFQWSKLWRYYPIKFIAEDDSFYYTFAALVEETARVPLAEYVHEGPESARDFAIQLGGTIMFLANQRLAFPETTKGNGVENQYAGLNAYKKLRIMNRNSLQTISGEEADKLKDPEMVKEIIARTIENFGIARQSFPLDDAMQEVLRTFQSTVFHQTPPHLHAPTTEIGDMARKNYLELLNLLNRNLWLIQGKYSPDGVNTYDYHDKEALKFIGNEPDSEMIFNRMTMAEFKDFKEIVSRIIADRIKLDKLLDMSVFHPGDEDRMRKLAADLGIPIARAEVRVTTPEIRKMQSILRKYGASSPEIVFYPAIGTDVEETIQSLKPRILVGVDPIYGKLRRPSIAISGKNVWPLKSMVSIEIPNKGSVNVTRYEYEAVVGKQKTKIILYGGDANELTPNLIPETKEGFDIFYNQGWEFDPQTYRKSVELLREKGVVFIEVLRAGVASDAYEPLREFENQGILQQSKTWVTDPKDPTLKVAWKKVGRSAIKPPSKPQDTILDLLLGEEWLKNPKSLQFLLGILRTTENADLQQQLEKVITERLKGDFKSRDAVQSQLKVEKNQAVAKILQRILDAEKEESARWEPVRMDIMTFTVLSQLDHPSLPKVRLSKHGEGENAELVPQIRWVEGDRLERWAFNASNLSDRGFTNQIVNWLIQIGEAVSLLHKNGLEHGDLNADNIVIDKTSGNPVLIDWSDYATKDLETLPRLLGSLMIARVLSKDFSGRVMSTREYPAKRDKRFHSDVIQLSQRQYASAEEFTEALRAYRGLEKIRRQTRRGPRSEVRSDELPKRSQLVMPISDRAVHWKNIFGNSKPLIVDVGTGRGNTLTAQAQNQPDFNFIGIDQDSGRINNALQSISSSNVRLVEGDAKQIVKTMFRNRQVQEFQIIFPDPERVELEKKLVDGALAKTLMSKLKSGGRIVVVTEDAAYWKRAKKHFEKQSGAEVRSYYVKINEKIPESLGVLVERSLYYSDRRVLFVIEVRRKPRSEVRSENKTAQPSFSQPGGVTAYNSIPFDEGKLNLSPNELLVKNKAAGSLRPETPNLKTALLGLEPKIYPFVKESLYPLSYRAARGKGIKKFINSQYKINLNGNYQSEDKGVAKAAIKTLFGKAEPTEELAKGVKRVIGTDGFALFEGELRKAADEMIPQIVLERVMGIRNAFANESLNIPQTWQENFAKSRIPQASVTDNRNFVISTNSVSPDSLIHFVNDTFPKLGKESRLTVVYEKENEAQQIRAALKQTRFGSQIQFHRVARDLASSLANAYQQFGKEGAVVVAPSINNFSKTIAAHHRLVLGQELIERGTPLLAEDVLNQIGVPLAGIPVSLKPEEIKHQIDQLMIQWSQQGFRGVRFLNGIIPDLKLYLEFITAQFRAESQVQASA